MFQSITARLIAALCVGTTLLWCGAVAYASYSSYHELNEAFDLTLMEAAHRLLPLVAQTIDGQDRPTTPPEGHHGLRGEEYLSYQVSNAAGQIVFRAPDAPELPYHASPTPGFRNVGSYRIFTDTDEATGLSITVAETTHGRWEAVSNSIWAMLWPLALLLPLNVVLVWVTVRAAVLPVNRLSAAIAARSGQYLAPLDVSGQPLELRPIADAIARLLERLRAALDAERAFAANSAHELRTPIAGALAQTQLLIARLPPASPEQRRANDVETSLKKVAHLAEKLMQLSRVEAGFAIAEKPIDLIAVLDLVVGDCEKPSLDQGRIRYVKPGGMVLKARIDMDAFAIAMRNLIDNALNHGAPGGLVEVIVETSGAIRVLNEGVIVAPDVLAGLKRRFARGETSHSGSGLGLAIAETIAIQTGGTLDLFSPPPDRSAGFEARLTLQPVIVA